jgi:hypothetical protein
MWVLAGLDLPLRAGPDVQNEYSPERDQRTLVKGRCHH